MQKMINLELDMPTLIIPYTRYNFVKPVISEELFLLLSKDRNVKQILHQENLLSLFVFEFLVISFAPIIWYLLIYMDGGDIGAIVGFFYFFVLVSVLLTLPSIFNFYSDRKFYYKQLNTSLKSSLSYQEFTCLMKPKIEKSEKQSNLDLILQKYQSATDAELFDLYNKRYDLQSSAVILLEKELRNRKLWLEVK